jgi:thiamine monophosphate synthase
LRDRPVPSYAIGGLTRSDLAEAKRRGAHGVALPSAGFKDLTTPDESWMTLALAARAG